MRRENEKLIIDGNAYTSWIWNVCERSKENQEENGRCVEQSEERRQSAKPYRGLKTICRREFHPERG